MFEYRFEPTLKKSKAKFLLGSSTKALTGKCIETKKNFEVTQQFEVIEPETIRRHGREVGPRSSVINFGFGQKF